MKGSSTPSRWKGWIESFEFLTRIGDREAPVNGGLLGVALLFPGRDLTHERGFVGDTAVEALLLEHTQLHLGHVQPAPMLGGVRQLQLPGDAPRLSRLERFIERRELMRIEIVQHHPNHRGFWVAFVHQPLHRMREVDLGPLLCHPHMPPASLRFHKEKEVARAVAGVFVIVALRPPRLSRQRLPGLLDELLARLIKVHFGPGGIIGLRVDLQDVFHRGNELRPHLWDAPLLLQPRLEDRFFKTRRTLSYEYAAARPRATTRSASSCKVQRWRPSGAALQASAIRRACAFSSNLGCFPGRGRSSRASSPAATKRWRVRSTVARPTERATAMALSSIPSAAFSRIRARVTLRVACVPLCSRCSSCSRSSAFSVTRYFFLGIAGRPPVNRLTRLYPRPMLSINFTVMGY